MAKGNHINLEDVVNHLEWESPYKKRMALKVIKLYIKYLGLAMLNGYQWHIRMKQIGNFWLQQKDVDSVEDLKNEYGKVRFFSRIPEHTYRFMMKSLSIENVDYIFVGCKHLYKKLEDLINNTDFHYEYKRKSFHQ